MSEADLLFVVAKGSPEGFGGAQSVGESACLTSKRSLVRVQYRPPGILGYQSIFKEVSCGQFSFQATRQE